jgi:hypothetical protein
VAEVERDEFLRVFSHLPITDSQAWWWIWQWMAEKKNMKPNAEEMPGYEEMWQKILADAPKKLLRQMFLEDVPVEQRLAGLSLREQLLALPDEVLRGLSDAYVSSLPPETQKAIRERLSRSGKPA